MFGGVKGFMSSKIISKVAGNSDINAFSPNFKKA